MSRLSLRERSIALLLTLSTHLLLAFILLTNWTRPTAPAAAEALSAFDIAVPVAVFEPKPAQPKQRPQSPTTTAVPRPPLPNSAPAAPGPAPQPATSAVSAPPFPPVRQASASLPAQPVSPPPRQAGITKAAWEALVLARIESAKRYPRLIGSRRPTGTTTVEFRVSRGGALLAARVLRSSGNAALDRAAVQAVTRAAPYPAIPEDRASELTLSVPVIFLKAN